MVQTQPFSTRLLPTGPAPALALEEEMLVVLN